MKMRSVATGLLITVAFVAHAADDAPHWGYGGEHRTRKMGRYGARLFGMQTRQRAIPHRHSQREKERLACP